MPTYNNTPNANDRISDTQPLINQNFASIQTAFNENHVDLDAAAGTAGKHKFVDFTRQGADPGTDPTDVAMYAKVGTLSGNSELFIQPQNNGTAYSFTDATLADTGECILPCGLYMKWGRGETATNGLLTVNFANPFPTAIFTAQAAIAVVNGNSGNSESYDRTIRIYKYTKNLLSVVTWIDKTNRQRAQEKFTWFALGN